MKLWGGRFAKPTCEMVDDFHSSIGFDYRLYEQDIAGSIAHATMLGERGIIPAKDAQAIVSGLADILEDIRAGRVHFEVDAEDIHMNIEKLLTQRIGEAGKRLHTGRSRNDQVALDTRMYVLGQTGETTALLENLCRLLLKLSQRHLSTVMPGYTHLQKAQPVTLAHHLMAYFQMFSRDIGRFQDAKERADEMPLGSGALAGTTYPINRERVAEILGFKRVTQNSLDAVSDRDYIIEYVSCAGLCMMHLSRFCEELILWSSHEFGFAEMDDAYATGSSIMPQKKNPDVAELIRGKTGRVYGDLIGLLSMMKSLPLSYNKDMQEDKEALFDACDTLKKCLEVFAAMLSTVTFRKDRMQKGAGGGFTNATDAADYLVKKGLPFREAHEIVGKLVALCIQKDISLGELGLADYQALSPAFEEDVYRAIDLKTCVDGRALPGGPAEESVKQSIEAGYRLLDRLMA